MTAAWACLRRSHSVVFMKFALPSTAIATAVVFLCLSFHLSCQQDSTPQYAIHCSPACAPAERLLLEQGLHTARQTLTFNIVCRGKKGQQRPYWTSTPRREVGSSWTTCTSCRAGSPTLSASWRLLLKLLILTSDASSPQSQSMELLRYQHCD